MGQVRCYSLQEIVQQHCSHASNSIFQYRRVGALHHSLCSSNCKGSVPCPSLQRLLCSWKNPPITESRAKHKADWRKRGPNISSGFFDKIVYSRVIVSTATQQRASSAQCETTNNLIWWFIGGEFDVATFSDSLVARATAVCFFPVSLHGFDPDAHSVLQRILTIIAVISRQLLPTAVSHNFLWNLIQVTGLQRLYRIDKKHIG